MLGEKSYMFLRNCFCLREPLDDIAIAPSAQLLDDITSVAIGTAMSVVRATDSLYRKNNRPISSIYISEASSTAKTQEKKKAQQHQYYCLYFFPNFTQSKTCPLRTKHHQLSKFTDVNEKIRRRKRRYTRKLSAGLLIAIVIVIRHLKST